MYIDTHLDAFYHMRFNNRGFNAYQEQENVHVDIVRARKGGLGIGFFTGFPNCAYFFSDEAGYKIKPHRDDITDVNLTEEFLRDWIEITRDESNGLRVLKSKSELKEHLSTYKMSETQKIGCIMHFEGAAGIDESLHRLYIYHEAGLRSMGLTWNETNQFATGAPGDKNRGLTESGKDLLSAMETLGILIDVSHLNDKSFWDVVANTNKPIFASHSNLRKRANVIRNLENEMVLEIAKSGGSVGINLCKGFLSTDKEHNFNMQCVIEMIKGVIEITGTCDAVHIGTDFDGCQTPADLKDVSYMPKFFASLKEKLELSDEDLRKIQYGNVVRIIENYW